VSQVLVSTAHPGVAASTTSTIVDRKEEHNYQPGYTLVATDVWPVEKVRDRNADFLPASVEWVNDWSPASTRLLWVGNDRMTNSFERFFTLIDLTLRSRQIAKNRAVRPPIGTQMTMPSASVDDSERFSLVAGGPFHRLLRRLGLIGADQLPTWQAAVGLALIAWMLPAILAILQSLVDDGYSGRGYFSELTAYARFLICIFAMVATERYADGRFVLIARQFREARLLDAGSLPAFHAALATADRRSSSPLAEGLIAVLALVWPGVVAGYTVSHAGASWEGTIVDREVSLSWAGAAARWVSTPIFVFLMLRWIWWFIVWAVLLLRLSRMRLQLMPLHPDRAGGLGFMSVYPSVFGGFVLALSCVVASAMLKELSREPRPPEIVWAAMGVWIAIVLVLFIGPLLVFAVPLSGSREQALFTYGRLASQHHLVFHEKWIGASRSGDEIMGSPDPSSASDLNASVQAIRDMRFVPIDRAAIVQLVVAAGSPMLGVVATLVPLDVLVKWLIGQIL